MRNNIVEKVIIEDKAVVSAIMVAKEFARSDFAYASSEGQLSADLKWLGSLGGLPLSNLTLYALRWGGATFDLQQHSSWGETTSWGAGPRRKRQGSTSTNQWPSRQKSRLPLKVEGP